MFRRQTGTILGFENAHLHAFSVSLPFSNLLISCGGHAIDNNRHTVSVGCAPTPTQYLARVMSSLMSLCNLPEGS